MAATDERIESFIMLESEYGSLAQARVSIRLLAVVDGCTAQER